MITVQATVNASLDHVWSAYTSPEAIVHWNAASDDWHTTRAAVDLRVGGAFCSRMEAKDGSMAFDFEGVYTEVEPMSLLAYQFGERKARVEFTDSPAGVQVSVTFEPEEMHSLEQQREGWLAILDKFILLSNIYRIN